MNLSTAETIQSQFDLMSFQFSQQEIFEMTDRMLQARVKSGIPLVVKGIVHSYEVLIEKQFIIPEQPADESDYPGQNREVCDAACQVPFDNLSSSRPVGPIQPIRLIQRSKQHFKEREYENFKAKSKYSRPQSVDFSSRSMELLNKVPENVLNNKPAKNQDEPQIANAHVEYYPIETARNVSQGSASFNAYLSRSIPSHSTSKPLKEDQKIFLKSIRQKSQQIKYAADLASTHAQQAENSCFLATQFANNTQKYSKSNIEEARVNESKTAFFQMQAQKSTQDTIKEALHCSNVLCEIRNLLKVVNQLEQMEPSTANRLTKVILTALNEGEKIAGQAAQNINRAFKFSKLAANQAQRAKSAIKKAKQAAKQLDSKNRNPQKALKFYKPQKGSKQDEKKLKDLQHQISQQRLRMKRQALSLRKEQ